MYDISRKEFDIPKERLNFLLQFINLDISSLDDGSLFNLWVGLRRIAFGALGPFAIPDNEIIQWPKSRVKAIKIQKVLKNLLDNVFSTSKKPKKRVIRPIFEITDEMLELIEKSDSVVGSPAIEETIYNKWKKKPISRWAKDYIAHTFLLEFNIFVGEEKVEIICTDIEKKIILEFVSALSHFPLSSIKRCQWCNAWFLQPGKKEKNFCSTQHYFAWAQKQHRKKIKNTGKKGKEEKTGIISNNNKFGEGENQS